MIRREGSNGVWLITQDDHAALARQIAEHWGNGDFQVPQPRDAVVEAIGCHDAGWSLHDGRPCLNPDKTPASFYELPIERYIRVWVASVSAAAARGGPMAGLVVSWHVTSLVLRAPTDGQSEPVRNMVHNFVAAQRARQADYCRALALSDALAKGPEKPATDRDRIALYNFAVLRGCDWISLLLCARELPPSLQRLVLNGEFGVREPFQTRWIDERTLHLAPWPLSVPHLQLRVLARRVPAGKYRGNADLVRVYDQSRQETLTFTLSSSPHPVRVPPPA